MKVKKRNIFAMTISIFVILSCNLPGSDSKGTEAPESTVAPTEPPGLTIENTATEVPTETLTPPTSTPSVSPEITLTKNSNCRIGPSTFYNIIDQIAEKKVLPVIGRNEDSTWWQVTSTSGKSCWIFSENSDENSDFSGIQIGGAPALPATPSQFNVIDQLCQPGPKKFSVTLSWVSGGGETSFKLYRQGKQIFELKAGKYKYKDSTAPLSKNLTYEIEAVNQYGTSDRAFQVVPECK